MVLLHVPLQSLVAVAPGIVCGLAVPGREEGGDFPGSEMVRPHAHFHGAFRGLQKLGKEGEGGDYNGVGPCETVGGDVGGVENDLEGMGGTGEALEMGQGRGKAAVGGFGFREKPGVPVVRNEEIDFAFLLVAQIEQLEGAESEVSPAFDGLEQVAGEEGFVSLSGVGDAGPVAEIPFRGFPEGGFDVAVPGADGESKIQGGQEGNPAFHGRFGNGEVAGQGSAGKEGSGAFVEDEGKGFDQGEVRGAREIAEVFAEELLEAETLPFAQETGLADGEGFGKSAEDAERIPKVGGESCGGPDEIVSGKVRPKQFGNGEGVDTVGEIAAHHAVPAALVDVHAGRTGGDDAAIGFVFVEETLEKSFPTGMMVDFVKGDDRQGGRDRGEPGGFGHGCGTLEDEGTITRVVPRQKGCGKRLGEGGFADLARSGQKNHLAAGGKMIAEDCSVETRYGGNRRHGSISCSRCSNDALEYMVDRRRWQENNDEYIRMVMTIPTGMYGRESHFLEGTSLGWSDSRRGKMLPETAFGPGLALWRSCSKTWWEERQ